MKKVLLIVPSLKTGGTERVVSRLSYLLRDKYDIKVLVFDDSNMTYSVGCDLISIKLPSKKGGVYSKIKTLLKRVKEINKVIRENEIEYTYSFGDSANIVNALAINKSKKITSIRGYRSVFLEGNNIKKLIKIIYNKFIFFRSKKIVSVSKDISDVIIRSYKTNKNKLHTIYNGYDVKDIIKLSTENLIESENNIFKNRNIIISVGTFKPEKGFWHLIKAFSTLEFRKDNLMLVIIGDDYESNKNKVVNLIKELGIDNYVTLLDYKTNPFKYISRSKVYVLSSVFEGFPNSLVEAMSCGIPVIASNCKTGPKELLFEAYNNDLKIDNHIYADFGIITPDMNKIENYNSLVIENEEIVLGKAIKKLLNNEDDIKKYKIKSLERSELFSYQNWVKAHEKLLD